MKSFPLTLTDPTLFPGRVCVIQRRDGTVYRIADADEAIVAASNTYVPVPGLNISAVRHTIGGDPASVQIECAHSVGGVFDTEDIHEGRFDAAIVSLGIVNRSAPNTIGTLFTGTIQPVSYTIQGDVAFDVRGLAADQVGIFTQKYQPMCRTDLGSILCRVPILPTGAWFIEGVERATVYAAGQFARVRFVANGTPDDYLNRYLEATTGGTTDGSAPTFSSTIDDTTADGSVVWTTREAWTRWARVDDIINSFAFTLQANPDATRGVDGWFNQGVFVMRSGQSDGWGFEVGAWEEATLKITSYMSIGNLIAPGDWLEIYPGCNKTLDAGGCPKFENQINYQGEAHFLGVAAVAAAQ